MFMENKIGFSPSYFSIEDVYILIASTRDQKHFLFYYEKAISLYRSNILTKIFSLIYFTLFLKKRHTFDIFQDICYNDIIL